MRGGRGRGAEAEREREREGEERVRRDARIRTGPRETEGSEPKTLTLTQTVFRSGITRVGATAVARGGWTGRG